MFQNIFSLPQEAPAVTLLKGGERLRQLLVEALELLRKFRLLQFFSLHGAVLLVLEALPESMEHKVPPRHAVHQGQHLREPADLLIIPAEHFGCRLNQGLEVGEECQPVQAAEQAAGK